MTELRAEQKAELQNERDIYGNCRSVSCFLKLNKIGEGTYGSVYKAQDKQTKETVALKRVKLDNGGFDRDGMPVTALREVNILQKMSHPNIVKLKEVVVGAKHDSLFLVFEYCDHDLAKLLDSMRTPFSESEIKCLMLQLLSAVAHLHDNWVIHRDLKLSNLLFNSSGQLKLCDFGLARQFGQPLRPFTPKVVTLWYRAPELLLGDANYTTAIDMWALGCMMAELLMHTPVMPGKNEPEQLKMMCELLGTPNDRIWPGFSALPLAKKVSLPVQPYNELPHKFSNRNLSPEAFDLLNGLLTYDPRKRLSAKEALQHTYFRQKPLPKLMELMPTFPTLHDKDCSGGRTGGRISPTNSANKCTQDSRFGSIFGGDISAKKTKYAFQGD